MEHSGLLLPLGIIARNLDTSLKSNSIRANFVKKTMNLLKRIAKIPASEKDKVLAFADKIAEREPDLASALRAKV